jgi:hypothetical protein
MESYPPKKKKPKPRPRGQEIYLDDGSVCVMKYAEARLPVKQDHTVFCDCSVTPTEFSNISKVNCEREQANSVD